MDPDDRRKGVAKARMDTEVFYTKESEQEFVDA